MTAQVLSEKFEGKRLFATSAVERYDKALRKSLKMNPLPEGMMAPRPSCEWPEENVVLLEKYRNWLVAIGASTAVINSHRIPLAGTMLGLALKPHPQLCLDADTERTQLYIRSKKKSGMWERNCDHSLTWFCRFLKEERGMVIIDKQKFGDIERYKKGLPDWLIKSLTRFLHLRQANWRKSRMAQSTYHFWYKSTQLWRWLFEHTEIQFPSEISREHLNQFVDEKLVAGYKVASINHDIHTFQGTLYFLQDQGIEVPRAILRYKGLKKPQTLPRFLTDKQIVALRDDLIQRRDEATTTVQERNSRLDLACFTLLWQTGMRVSELEDLLFENLDLEGMQITIRNAKGLKDRMVYLTEAVVEAIQDYLTVRGPALTDHVFIYRHKFLSKDFVRSRLRTAGKRLGFKVTPHMLRHTFATQLVNAGADIVTIQTLMGHKRLNTTMTYAHVHDETVARDYFRAMEQIEGPQFEPETEQIHDLIDQLEDGNLTEHQQKLLDEFRQSLVGD
ncbi:MAG: tyrosine-type recombinase/integrase [Anaerolineae bacterium]